MAAPDELNPQSINFADDGRRMVAQADSAVDLKKPHEMIVLKPRTGRVTLTGRRLYNAMLQNAQTTLEAMAELPRADYLFEAPLGSLLKVSGSSGDARTAAKRYLREMRGLEVDWESTAPGDGVKWRGFAMLSEVNIEVRRGENWVTWAYPPAILTAIRGPQRWARIDLSILANLSTYAALALYEICARYRDNPSFVTSRKPCDWWIDALSSSPPGTERREWRKFKNERIQPAIEEICSGTDLHIDLLEHKQGRQIVEVQFAVRKRKAIDSRPAKPADSDLVQFAHSLGVQEDRLDRLVQQFGDEAVRRELVTLARRVASKTLPQLHDRYAYLRTVLANRPGDSKQEHAPETSDVSPIARPPSALRSPPSALAVVQCPDKVSDQVVDIKRQLGELAPDKRKYFVELALEYLRGRGLLVPSVRRRADQGDIFHGMLGFAVAQAFAREELGIDLGAPADTSVA